MSIRLNKLLANRGIASRRRCDTLIAEGRVRVNGRVVNEPGSSVEEGRDRVEVDGRPLPGRQSHVYYVLNKPVGVITTLDDPQGRRTVRELLPRGARVYPVGRLDADTSGLLLLTNDGELAHRLMHPRYGVVKVYRVRLEREPSRAQLERLARGVEFEPGVTSAPARIRRIDPGFEAIMIEVIIHEGRFRQVRRMCEAVGLRVTGLHRVGYGPIRLGPLARGLYRELSEDEVARLRAASARPVGTRPRRATPGPARSARPPARPSRTTRPQRPLRAGEQAPEEIGETWIPGGGFTRDLDLADESPGAEPPAWPARADRRRGDAGFTGTPAPRGERRPASTRTGRSAGTRGRDSSARTPVTRDRARTGKPARERTGRKTAGPSRGGASRGRGDDARALSPGRGRDRGRSRQRPPAPERRGARKGRSRPAGGRSRRSSGR